MDTFRAIVAVDEKSERALQVTEVLIKLNPGHYSIWSAQVATNWRPDEIADTVNPIAYLI